MENTKCECGHQNPIGTVLCESCGKPLVELGSDQAPLEMRYDGVARRSQRANPSIIDRVWRFFSSVKIAVYMIIITLVTATLGTILPQENTILSGDVKRYYADNHGVFGEIYYFLGLSHTYETWWFRLLLVMIGASLVVCSLDRVLPLYRALNKQAVRKHPIFLRRQKAVYEGEVKEEQVFLDQFAAQLKRRFYRVTVEDGALMAEKNRFSRWGPYINHIGLIIFLLAVLMRMIIPGWSTDLYVSIKEGDMIRIEGTNYYLENEQFTVEFYSEEEMDSKARERGQILPKRFETKAVLYECVDNCDRGRKEAVLEEVHRQNIEVNDPLKYKNLLAYQFHYEFTPEIVSLDVELTKRTDGAIVGDLHLETADPGIDYEVGDYKLELIGYYPDFVYENGLPATKSGQPNAPAFIFSITGPDLEEEVVHMYFPRPEDKEKYQQDRVNELAGSPFIIEAGSMDNVNLSLYTSSLNIRSDRGMSYIWIGAAISMIGLVMGFYWHHRRIWLRIDHGKLLLGAHTNKNWFGIRKELASLFAHCGIEVDPKSLENEVRKK